MTSSANFIHRFVPPQQESDIALLLLHGTGGNEDDLLDLGRAVSQDAALLSPRGQVLENGAPRFFRRFAEGVFDKEDIIYRAAELAGFIKTSVSKYQINPNKIYALGYSNGANIANAVMLLHPGLLRGGILLRPMTVIEPDIAPSLKGTKVLMSAGEADPIIPRDSVENLAELFVSAGADVDLKWQRAGHNLVQADVDQARDWLLNVSSSDRAQSATALSPSS